MVRVFGEFVGGNDSGDWYHCIPYSYSGAVHWLSIKVLRELPKVTARFTLDAMPGKQMAIDADLNTGAISDKEAMLRREKLQQDSFSPSSERWMGATKYVKGDATAGLIITVVNIVGGIIMGVMRKGMNINDALTTYTILTIGDGLVSQIPSLLISLSTGIIITKATKDKDLHAGKPAEELFSMPKAFFMVGGAMIFLGCCHTAALVVFSFRSVLC